MLEIKKQSKSANNKAKKQPSGKPFIKNDPRINKKGRPKDSFSLLTILKRELQAIPPEYKGKERKQYAELLIKKQLYKAIIEGDEQSIKLIWNYVEGTPIQKVIGPGEEGEHIIKWL